MESRTDVRGYNLPCLRHLPRPDFATGCVVSVQELETPDTVGEKQVGYSVRPGCKQTEVGLIPTDWDIVAFDTAFQIPSGQVDPRLPKHRNRILVAPDHLESRSGRILSQETAARQNAISGKYVFGTGDIVYSKIRPYLRKAWHATFSGLCSADMYPLRARTGFDSGFLVRIVLSEHFSQYAESVSVRSGMPKINRDELSAYSFACPPTLAEQEAIAEALGDANALVESLERLLAKKRNLKQAVMQQLLTGKKRLPRFEKTSGFKDSDVGVIPKDWEVRLLPDVARFRGGKAHEQFISDSGTFVCVNSKFISSEGSVRKFSTKSFCTAKSRDVLMVMSDLPNGKALAKAYFVDVDDLYAVNQRVCALSAFAADPKYLYYRLNRNPYFLKFDDGVTQTHLLNAVFEKCPIACPESIEEQNAIGQVLSDMDAEIIAIEAKIDKARQIKAGMMQELLTGRVRLVTPAKLRMVN